MTQFAWWAQLSISRGKCAHLCKQSCHKNADKRALLQTRLLHFPAKNSARTPLSLYHICEYPVRSLRSSRAIAYRAKRKYIYRENDEFALGCLINFIRAFNYADAFFSFCCHIAAVSRREGNSQSGIYSSCQTSARSESLICTVRILMDPDILCPAQVIPVGFKGTACA